MGSEKLEWKNVISGVLQGSSLGLLLFLLYINSIFDDIDCKYHIYADDNYTMKAQWMKSTSSISALTLSVISVVGCLKAIGLKVNPKKSQAIIIGYSRLVSKINTEDLNKINIEEIEVPFVDKVLE